ncbi:S1 family peptidase ASCRUDRAFT_7882 [Ascoidea rubescens DSM 1968]|uniref:Trypsin-like serine protease n=1 Tax=Ascoidea rubescens DSM 1968 TaxID=1344418 RepID=A0A1D2VJA2_9ASCO|nr:hypothetical protein ASCRUDRAFT_7882 [Ascoidea rubescens DSM 1968]ODV61689.1 hypothetical protein ASCRUDRAFT_7882 [Ascoidea rubescens DSM 1968]
MLEPQFKWVYTPVTIHLTSKNASDIGQQAFNLKRNNYNSHPKNSQILKYHAISGIYLVLLDTFHSKNFTGKGIKATASKIIDQFVLSIVNLGDIYYNYTVRFAFKLNQSCQNLNSGTKNVLNWYPLKISFIKQLNENLIHYFNTNFLFQNFTFLPFYDFENNSNLSIIKFKAASNHILSDEILSSFSEINFFLNFTTNNTNLNTHNSQIAIQSCPFSLTNPSLFLNFSSFSNIIYNINIPSTNNDNTSIPSPDSSLFDQLVYCNTDYTLAYLSDFRYLDNINGGIVNLINLLQNKNPTNDITTSIGLIAGAFKKKNGDGELSLIISWYSILNVLLNFDTSLHLSLTHFQNTILFPNDLINNNNNKTQANKMELIYNSINRENKIKFNKNLTVSKNIKPITVLTNDGDLFWGSSIILTPTVIITNNHVINPYNDLTKIKKIKIWLNNINSLSNDDFQLIESPITSLDLIFIFLKKPLPSDEFPTLTIHSNDYDYNYNYDPDLKNPRNPYEKNSSVTSYSYGLFLNQNSFINKTKIIINNPPLITLGKLNLISSINLELLLDDKPFNINLPSLLISSASCFNGSSGGGIFNENGHLIGMITSNGKLSNNQILNKFTLIIPYHAINLSLILIDQIKNLNFSFFNLNLNYNLKFTQKQLTFINNKMKKLWNLEQDDTDIFVDPNAKL